MRKQIVFIILMFSLFGCNKNLNLSNASSQGRIVKHTAFPSIYVASRNIDVWLPPGYARNKRQKYDVLIMHDGQMLYDSTTTWNRQEWGVDETMTQLIGNKQIKPCIVVGVWNTPLRFAEYMPQKPMAGLPDSLLQKVRGFGGGDLLADNYLRFLTLEVLPYIEKQYRIKPGKEHRFIAGSSMGGLISMYAISEYPEVFGGAACLSTHWPIAFNNDYPIISNAVIDYFANHLPDVKTHKIYFDYGTATLDALYKQHQMRMDEKMQEHGYTKDVNWVTREFPGADHSEKSWRERLAIPLLFLLK